jgi:tetratricopeptide (TPR) repeat protein
MKKLLSATLLAGSLALSLNASTLDECEQAYNAGAFDKAEASCIKASKEDSNSYMANYWLCRTYNSQGEFKKMLPVAQKLEKLAKTLEEYKVAYSYEGVACNALGDKKQALKYYLKNLEVNKKTGDRGDIGNSLHNLGEYYRGIGNSADALKYLTEALEYKTNKASLANTYNSLGILYGKQGDTEKSIAYYQKAAQYAKEGGDFVDSAHYSVGLGAEYGKLERYNEAKQQFDDALQIARDRGNKTLESYALRNLGNLALVQNDKTTAKRYLTQALEIAKATGNSFEVQKIESLLQQVNR